MEKNNSDKDALQEKAGIVTPDSLSNIAAETVKKHRKKSISTAQRIEGILNGDKTHLSRAISLIESTATRHKENAKSIIEACLPYANQSLRIGITGVPGVGKSTFIERFGMLLTSQGKKVAVLAVDPSSSLSKGSILGDKTRMEELVKNPNAFIRPSASGDTLGGVAQKTREAIILCEAAGYDTIIIETVGVGQSETAVHSMTDFFLLLKLAGAGDELQGIKRGIMEMADVIVINKADGENQKAAKLAKTAFNRALHLYPVKESGWTPKAITCSAIENIGIEEVWNEINSFVTTVIDNGSFQYKRKEQNKFWLLQTVEASLKNNFYQHPKIKKELTRQLELLDQNKTTPFAAAKMLLAIV